ncbi:MAG: MotA/TolQ/ExbB proton channel family protein [Verrucomicrobiota bacterium]|jgi:biopolymer transport protein ExbB|nr:MotA/TolQ/ExbB proton channel family protein [Verrucomicrobiota bacterium]MEE2813778.1 MotA/TolQ/ExbB proton channel family protein [Verrucomicrobiota bacterium]
MVWMLLIASALGIVVFVERRLAYHRVQINTTALLGGLKNVLSQNNLVEAIGICDATPSPTARIVKVVLENHQLPREEVKEILEQHGSEEVALLEQRLGVLSTIGQIAPLLGLLGAVLGFMETGEEVITDHHAHFAKSLMPLALGLAIGVPCYVGYNHLVAVIGTIIIDMQKAGLRALRMVGELKGSVRRGRKKVKLEALDNSVEFGEEEKK